MAIHGSSKDPTWGPFAQQTSKLESQAPLAKIKAEGGRVITWIEGFGDCMLYAAAFQKNPDGSFVSRDEERTLAKVLRSHWNWADARQPAGNALRWVGIHNLVDNEDFCAPLNARLGLLTIPPTYPDGRPALGIIPGAIYPLNHRVYDACGSKNLNGVLYANFEAPTGVNAVGGLNGKPAGPIEGLYPTVLGKDDIAPIAGRKPGETIYCGVISVHKDLSAPFWSQYVRRSIREIVKAGLDGVWCDNYSPWDNFGYPPVQKAFGDWSVALFHAYVKQNAAGLIAAGSRIDHIAAFDVRTYLKARAAELGAADPTDLNDAAWHDARWLRDPVWNSFKAFRQASAQERLSAFYTAIHEEATAGGRPDFCIGGNDVPLYGLGWVRDGWQDMINTETTPGWHMGSGTRGIMIPPLGKMAVLYRAALEHQKGPFSAAWYYLNGNYARYQQRPEIGKVLCAEAFANGALLLCMPDNKEVCGTVKSHSWWNHFVRDNEANFGKREPLAEVGVLFSPDNQLQMITPGGYTDMDVQPHIFGHHGWATACIDMHIPYRAVTDWKLTPAVLERLKTLVLPHAESLSDAALDAIVAWTRAGGRLVLSGNVGGLHDPAKWFAPRISNLLAQRLGVNKPVPGADAVAARVGKGSVVWSEDNPGMEYYLKHNQRSDLLAPMQKILGNTGFVNATSLPTTVGVFTWRSSNGAHLFVDLVNYDLDADADSVKTVQGLTLSIRLPEDWLTVNCETISPDLNRPAEASFIGGYAFISLNRLSHYASIKLSR